MHRTLLLSALASAVVVALAVGAGPSDPNASPDVVAPSARAATQPGVHRVYGPPRKVGNGMARAYVELDETEGRTPIEVGMALSETALEGLPASGATPMSHDSHKLANVHLLEMPAQNPTPYRFAELDWNPAGHEPPGVYDVPHFDFHFYTVSQDLRAAILPSDPQFATAAANLPAAPFRPSFYLDAATLASVPAAAASVPMMGLHWLSQSAPEIQALAGHPEKYQPFTRTFIYGSWNGSFIFGEPMITRAHLLSVRGATDPASRDEIIPVSTATRYAPAGYYPGAYRIAYDAQAKEYRVGLTQLTWRD